VFQSGADRAGTLDPGLRLSPRLMAPFFALAAMAVEIAGEATGASAGRFMHVDLALVLFVVAGMTLLSERLHPQAARWTVVVGLLAVLYLGSQWFEDQSALIVLLGIPVAAAAVFVSLAGAAGCALGATVLVAVLHGRAGLPTNLLAPSLLSIWLSWLAMAGAYLPVLRLGAWATESLESAQLAVGSARSRLAELEQALSDLANANRQLALAGRRLADLRHQAEAAERTKRIFVAKVSHELRTPLNMIIGLVHLMVESPQIYAVTLPPEMMHDLGIVHRNGQHLARMIDDVLDLTRAESGRLELHMEDVNLDVIVHSAVEAVRPLVEKKGLGIDIEVPADLPQVHCDRTRIQQVVLNLVSNAARYTEEGHIAISLESGGGTVVVSVADTGPGIASVDLERIFEPFCQASPGTWLDTGGAGLGLTVSREFVRRHGGRMWVESKVGVGSRFVFELPASPVVDHKAPPGRWLLEDWVWREQAFRTERSGLSASHGTRRVVIWDQNGALRSALGRLDDETDLVYADDLSSAIQAASVCPADIVIANARSRDEVWAAIADLRPRVPHTPLAACCVPPRIDRALQAGAAGYLTKPVTFDDLAEAVESVSGNVERILIVDDERDVVQLWSRMLQALRDGLAISVAYSGEQALDKMRRTAPDLVLLDVVMPELDGWEVLNRKQRDPVIRKVPVILVSGRDPAEEPPASQFLITSVEGGLRAEQLLECALAHSDRLIGREARRPEPRPDLSGESA
jgi:signal transduction histidine kinase/CheY-like chemotaxis protein